jgi:hypothetical protein
MEESFKFQYDPKNIHSRKYIVEKILEMSEDNLWEVSITKNGSKKSRSADQLSYTWGCVLDVLKKETGICKEDLWELLKMKFNPKVHFLPTGEPVLLGQSTKLLNTKQYEDFLEQVRIWALTELNITIPLPNEKVNS